MGILSTALTILVLVSQGMVLKKAGRPWWAVLIPYYGTYELFNISGKRKLFWVKLAVNVLIIIAATVAVFSLLGMIVSNVGFPLDPDRLNDFSFDFEYQEIDMTTLLVGICAIVLYSILSLVDMIITGVAYWNLSLSFGYEGAFGFGLLFLPYVFFAIIAFGDKSYIGGGPAPASGPDSGTYFTDVR